VETLGVIQPVEFDTYPLASPDSAVLAFWVNIGLNLLVALTLVFIAIRSKGRSRASTFALVVLGSVVLLLGLALVDAAFALLGHGPAMRTVAILLFFCAAADLLAGVLVITAIFLRPKKT
jgi:hypothetical protein